MLNSGLKNIQIFFFTLTTILFLVSCQHSSNLTGKWQEIGKNVYLEFSDEKTFKAVDSMGMAVTGTYSVDNEGNVRFEIRHDESNTEIIEADVKVSGDELTVDFGDTQKVVKYKRVMP